MRVVDWTEWTTQHADRMAAGHAADGRESGFSSRRLAPPRPLSHGLGCRIARIPKSFRTSSRRKDAPIHGLRGLIQTEACLGASAWWTPSRRSAWTVSRSTASRSLAVRAAMDEPPEGHPPIFSAQPRTSKTGAAHGNRRDRSGTALCEDSRTSSESAVHRLSDPTGGPASPTHPYGAPSCVPGSAAGRRVGLGWDDARRRTWHVRVASAPVTGDLETRVHGLLTRGGRSENADAAVASGEQHARGEERRQVPSAAPAHDQNVTVRRVLAHGRSFDPVTDTRSSKAKRGRSFGVPRASRRMREGLAAAAASPRWSASLGSVYGMKNT
jgi:hypothetical protein